MTFIRTTRDKEKSKYEPISNYYPYSQFSELYKLHKLDCHVFAPEDCVKEVSKSAREIFKSDLGIEFFDKSIVYA